MNFEGLGDLNSGFNSAQINFGNQNLMNPSSPRNIKSNIQPSFNFDVAKSSLGSVKGVTLGSSSNNPFSELETNPIGSVKPNLGMGELKGKSNNDLYSYF